VHDRVEVLDLAGRGDGVQDDFDQAGLPEPMSPKLVTRNGTRPAGAVRNVACTGGAPSLSTEYT
jgi:hypothetical protein